mmetsp:Transcript_32556/g.56331  ORF Transcript_32556/g.56331 Transcript_32556/m.56331 type:complete len:294 (+) Transcript_32556:285-1166(+)
MSEETHKSPYKDFVAGTVGGWSQVLAGQPFDIVKVRMASSTTPLGVNDVAMQIVKNEGVLSFWKGSIPPLVGVGACVSIQFGVLGIVKKKLKDYNGGAELSLKQVALSGSIAGMANAFVACPVEGFRIRMQVQGRVDSRGDPHYKGDIDCVKKVFQNHGLRGCYNGFAITLLREACTFSTYFSTYEYLVNNMKPEGGTVADCKTWQLILAGGLSGVMYWAPWYPIDSIKSKLQADSLANPRYSSTLDCIQKTMATDGIKGFYRGFLPCLLRAFPANSATFLAYEMTMRLIGRD